jgi:hypothetical protein
LTEKINEEEVKIAIKEYFAPELLNRIGLNNIYVFEDLNKKGIEVIDTVEQLKEIKEGTVVIRSHGVAKEIYDILEQQKLKMVDAFLTPESDLCCTGSVQDVINNPDTRINNNFFIFIWLTC